MTATDRDLIAEGRTLLAAATDAPWQVDVHSHLEKGCRCLCCHDSPTVALTTNMLDCQDIPVPDGADQTRCEQSGFTWGDAELIVWVRNNLPALLDAAEKLARVRAVLVHVRPICDRYPDDDAVSCGWKRAVGDIRHAIEGDEKP